MNKNIFCPFLTVIRLVSLKCSFYKSFIFTSELYHLFMGKELMHVWNQHCCLRIELHSAWSAQQHRMLFSLWDLESQISRWTISSHVPAKVQIIYILCLSPIGLFDKHFSQTSSYKVEAMKIFMIVTRVTVLWSQSIIWVDYGEWTLKRCL